MRLKHVVPAVLAASAILSLVRVTVLFAESWAAVRAERTGDAALLQICEEQTLAASDKFRNACLAARADSAAPVLLKTLMRSVHTAFTDFCEAFNTPTRLCLLILFLLSGVSAPIVKALVTTLMRGATAKEDEDIDHENTRLVILPPDYHQKASTWSRVRRRLRSSSTPKVHEVESDDEMFHECGQEPPESGGWAPLQVFRNKSKVHEKHL
jgi:hypothetical protein